MCNHRYEGSTTGEETLLRLIIALTDSQHRRKLTITQLQSGDHGIPLAPFETIWGCLSRSTGLETLRLTEKARLMQAGTL